MFAKKLVFIAAAVALAMTPAVAVQKQTAHIKVHIVHGAHHKQLELADANSTLSQAGSAAEETAVGDDEGEVEEDDEEDAVTGSTAGSSKGAAEVGEAEEEDAEVGEEEGEVEEEEDETDASEAEDEEAVVAVETVAPKSTTAPSAPASALCSGKDESPMSVEGVEGIFCVTGQACVADIVGACPEEQEGLPLGAYCGKVKSGVLGCKPNTEETLKNAHKYKARAKHLAKALDAKYKPKPVVKKVSHKKH